MKRSPMPARKTWMKRGGPIVTAAPKRFHLRRAPMPGDLRDLVWDRARGRCDMCGHPLNKNRWECHHRKLRSQGGPDTPENLIALHGGCHYKAHNGRDWARLHGYIVHPNTDPATYPVFRHGLRWQSPVAGQWIGAQPPPEIDQEEAV